MRPRNNLLLYVLQILALCLGLSSDGWSPESLLPVILSPDANQRSPEFRCTDEFSWIRWPAQVSVSGALNYTAKSTATGEASRYAPHVYSGIGQGFTASMRPRNNLLLYVLQILALCLGLSSDGWSPESLLPVILSPDANQRSPEFRCTDEFSWIRWPAQVSVSGALNYTAKSTATGEASRYAPHVYSGIGQGFTASMRPRNNLLLYVLQLIPGIIVKFFCQIVNLAFINTLANYVFNLQTFPSWASACFSSAPSFGPIPH
ncbi:uncharacterized protein LOC119172803 isoform X5 [Rhipicephalus microplus]|uniref:uncharacterized protein LOC119172803 isoform X5 n=1 Tax=Rhipicephalus microplus TaxID=6941 RepID=UPI003F6B0B1E